MVNYLKAREAVESGKLAKRSAWGDSFIFQRPADELSVDFIVNKVKSLPQALKDYYVKNFAWTAAEAEAGIGPDTAKVLFTPYLCLKTAEGTIMNGWHPNTEQEAAEDWIILD